MTKATFPVTSEALTCERLTRVLLADDVMHSGKVSSFYVERVAVNKAGLERVQ